MAYLDKTLSSISNSMPFITRSLVTLLTDFRQVRSALPFDELLLQTETITKNTLVRTEISL